MAYRKEGERISRIKSGRCLPQSIKLTPVPFTKPTIRTAEAAAVALASLGFLLVLMPNARNVRIRSPKQC